MKFKVKGKGAILELNKKETALVSALLGQCTGEVFPYSEWEKLAEHVRETIGSCKYCRMIGEVDEQTRGVVNGCKIVEAAGLE